jgi:hypothetical protein
MTQTNILMDENMLTHVLTTNDIHPYNISLVSTLWSSSTVDYLLQKKDDADKICIAFWVLRIHAQSLWDIMPY